MNDSTISWESAVLWLRAQPEQADLVRACFYDDPLTAAAKRYAASSEWQAVRRLIGSGPGNALDLAAGRGIASYALAQDGWRVAAIEPDASALVGSGAIRSLARETRTEIAVVEAQGEQTPFAENSFDLVHCRQALHHARDLVAMCQEIARVLKPGGAFIATREHVLSRREDLPAFLQAHPLHWLYGGENAYLLAEYVQALEGAGLHLKRVLNPFESDINLFPSNKEEFKATVARRFHFPWPKLIPDACLRRMGERFSSPGRLYSFLAVKP